MQSKGDLQNTDNLSKQISGYDNQNGCHHSHYDTVIAKYEGTSLFVN